MSNRWQVEVGNISMTASSEKEETLPVLSDQPHIAVITTSYPYIGLPLKAARRADALIGLVEGHTWVECSMRPSLPDMLFDFGSGRRVVLTVKDYLLEVCDEIYGKKKCMSTFASLDTADGYGAISLESPFFEWAL